MLRKLSKNNSMECFEATVELQNLQTFALFEAILLHCLQYLVILCSLFFVYSH